MSRLKVSKKKLKQYELLINAGEKALRRGRRAYVFSFSTSTLLAVLTGFFLSGLKYSFDGLKNIAFDMIWFGLLFATVSLLIMGVVSIENYYEDKHKLERLKEEYLEVEP